LLKPPGSDEEIPVIEYQLQQWRLLPLLAATYALDNMRTRLLWGYIEFQAGLLMGEKSARQAELGRELHALSSSSKPVATWLARGWNLFR
jgi:acyl-CoA oxidase